MGFPLERRAISSPEKGPGDKTSLSRLLTLCSGGVRPGRTHAPGTWYSLEEAVKTERERRARHQSAGASGIEESEGQELTREVRQRRGFGSTRSLRVTTKEARARRVFVEPPNAEVPVDTCTRRRNRKDLAEARGFAEERQKEKHGETSDQGAPETPAPSPVSQDSEGEEVIQPRRGLPKEHLPQCVEDLLGDMAGSYGDTCKHAAAAAAEGSWMRSRVFLREMRKVAGVNYSVASSRANAIKVLDDITSDEEISSRTRRFPAEGAYVCLEEGEVCRLMGIIRAALAFRETEETREERTRVANTAGGAERREGPPHLQEAAGQASGRAGRPHRNEYNDSHMSFMHGCAKLVTGVTKGDYTYTQKKFEERLALTWAEG